MEIKPFKLPDSLVSDIKNVEAFHTAQYIIPRYLLTYISGVGCHAKQYNEQFDAAKVIDYLSKKGEVVEIIETKTLNSKRASDIKSYIPDDDFIDTDKTYLFFYKKNLVKVTINESSYDEPSIKKSAVKETCKMVFYAPVGSECVDGEFIQFIQSTDDPKIFLLNQEFGDFVFTKFSISLPKTFDVELNYGKEFIKINEKIISSLNENHSGLYMFHGPPGTGKSTYIKYLASELKKDVIFFPTTLIKNITNPEIINLMVRKQNCILILEDAEKAIIKRETNSEASLVSTLLNMTDGILGDVLKLNVIVTYNCERQEIDDALLRKGRLKAEHTFNPLSVENTKKLAKKLKLDLDVKEEMTLADIYNYKKDEELIGNKAALVETKPRIGFNV